MARIVQAVNQYGPKIEYNPMARLDQVADWMAMRTGLNKSEVIMVLQEINEAILFFNTQGIPIKLPGVGIFRPSVDRQGTFKINLRADSDLKRRINNGNAFTGVLLNKDCIGLDDAGYKTLWDADHPTDSLEI
jgi:hypothetical protein